MNPSYPNQDAAPPAPSDAASWRGHGHYVRFYEQDASLVEDIAEFLGNGLGGGEAAVLVAEPRHRLPVAQRLEFRGLDLRTLGEDSRFVALDAAQTASRFLVDGRPVPALFEQEVLSLIDRASAGGRRPVRVFGEMVALFWADGRRDDALWLERMWNGLLQRRPFSLLCAYPLSAFGQESDAAAFADVCREHSHSLPTEAYRSLRTDEERLAWITRLQQKAAALDGEVARRRGLEDLLRRRDRELSEYVDKAVEGVVDLDADGVVQSANPSYATLVGTSLGAGVGTSLVERLVKRAPFDATWASLLRGQEVRGVAVDLRREDGSIVRATIRSALLRVADQGVRMRWFLQPGEIPGPAA
jgi:PAS domain-containing protein